MYNYKKVTALAKELQDEFRWKITLVEALQIAAQIHIAECITNGLKGGVPGETAYLEAIGTALQSKPAS